MSNNAIQVGFESFDIDVQTTDILVSVSETAGRLEGAENTIALSPNQTTWTLPEVATRPNLSKLYINGQKQKYGVDYVINGLIVNWLGYPLRSHWTIDLYWS